MRSCSIQGITWNNNRSIVRRKKKKNKITGFIAPKLKLNCKIHLTISIIMIYEHVKITIWSSNDECTFRNFSSILPSSLLFSIGLVSVGKCTWFNHMFLLINLRTNVYGLVLKPREKKIRDRKTGGFVFFSS